MSRKAIQEIQKEVLDINMGVKSAFTKVADEFSEHLDTINANTSELGALSQALNMLEQKIDKLNERIDELSMPKNSEEKKSNVEFNLSIKEQEVFVSLYTSERFLSAKDISRSIGRTIETTNLILKKLISKKIPIIKETNGKENFYALEKYFKQLQAKQNVIRLHETVLRELLC